MIMLVSVMLDTGNGCDSLATANNSLLLLYRPTVVIYGWWCMAVLSWCEYRDWETDRKSVV